MKNSSLLKTNVVMLPQEFKDWKSGTDIIHTGIVLHGSGLDPYLDEKEEMIHQVLEIGGNPQHLYLTSSRKIKENTNTFKEGFNGDWYYNSIYKSIQQIGDITSFDFKIEATTNPELKLPLIPQSFIEEYVKLNGEIKEINIEMEDVCDETCNDIPSNINECCGQPNWKIKTNSGYIIVHSINNIDDEKPVSKMYSKEEVIEICELLNLAHDTKRIIGEESTFDFNKWIKKNL